VSAKRTRKLAKRLAREVLKEIARRQAKGQAKPPGTDRAARARDNQLAMLYAFVSGRGWNSHTANLLLGRGMKPLEVAGLIMDADERRVQ
jgi:hypothetical protein